MTTPTSRGVWSRKRKREAGKSFSGCGFRKELEGDSSHDSGAMEDGGLQGRLGSQEIDRVDVRSGGLNDSRDRRRLQTSEGESEEGLHQSTNGGSGCPDRMDLDSTLRHW